MSPFQIIGMDGGATKVSAWDVVKNGPSFSLGEKSYTDQYINQNFFDSGFSPVDIQIQLEEMATESVQLTPAEKQQGNIILKTFVSVIQRVHSGVPLLLGIGMPGLKTKNKRGIVAMANGPRIPNFCDLLEEMLSAINISLVAPIAQLGSDADYCGIGEEYATDGAFRNCKNGYYLGGGTGAADALKCDGKLLPLDQTKSWLAKTWEMKTDDDISLERFASAGGIQFIYSMKSGKPIKELIQDGIYPDQILNLAIAGNTTAIDTLEFVSKSLAHLFYERIETLFSGWQYPFQFLNPNRDRLEPTHPYLGHVFDRLIIGQRLGDLMETSKSSPYLWKPFLMHLQTYISNSDFLSTSAKHHYLNNGLEKLFFLSQLRDAPALGAGIDATLQFNR